MRNLLYAVLLIALSVYTTQKTAAQENADPDHFLTAAIHFRSIGPYRGGRSAAVTGVRGNPTLFYMGASGGGVWKTENGGNTWRNISDGFFGGSIGAVAVAPSDPNIIYVGGGEKTVRGNVSHGYGMWKSYDAGKTWKSIGLNDSRRIPRIRVHPRDPDIVYVAALGHLFGPNQQRGVFRSVDGGDTWERILFVSEEAGAVDLLIDPNNARVIYASTWKVLRTPYSLESGGEGSGIWKSVDGGDSWKEITSNPGLPKGMVGISGIAVSPVNSNRVWAIVEAAEGGLFRSDNAGETWTRINDERKLRQRAWYYTRIYAGPKNIDEVYVMNVRFWHSNDGGKAFSSLSTPHGDHHDLWIDPDRPERMAVADDGGAQVTYDKGQTWSTYMNQPTAQFYRVTTDDHFPYRIYGAQQDNSTVRILHRSNRGGIGERHWEPTAGGESGHIAPDPNDPEIVYGGSYGGYLTRVNHRTGERRNIHIWPDNPMGHGAGDLKYRFQWNFPIFFSRHDKKTLYAAANVLFKTEDGGGSWTQISGDLTRNDASKLGPSGGPITKDNTSVEYYCTIFAAAESALEPAVIWTGSDDGLLHITRDGGENWENVTPPGLPEWTMINSIEAHPTEKGGLYLAGTRYKLDDFKPYLYKTTDYGKTWTKIVDGIDRKHFTRVVRADPERPGLLYAGTESGLYISFNDGKNWKPFQGNLPVVPITDLALKNNDLIVATQGRSFWVLDDLTLVHQWNSGMAKKPFQLFRSRSTYRMPGGGGRRPGSTSGQNVAFGVPVRFWLKELPDKDTVVRLGIYDGDDRLVKSWSTKPKQDDNEDRLSLRRGINLQTWNMRYSGAESFEGLVLWGGGTQGPLAVPGHYVAKLTIGGDTQAAEFEIQKDPRSSATIDDLQAQFDFLTTVRDKLTETHLAIANLRDIRTQIEALQKRLKDQSGTLSPEHDGNDTETGGSETESLSDRQSAEDSPYQSLFDSGKKLVDEMTRIEKKLYQTQNQSPQDPLNFPIRLNNRLSSLVGVVSSGDNRPTRQAIEVRDALFAEIDQQLTRLNELISKDLAKFNEQVRDADVPAIFSKR